MVIIDKKWDYFKENFIKKEHILKDEKSRRNNMLQKCKKYIDRSFRYFV